MNFHRIVVGDLETNCYLVWDTSGKKILVVDPGARADLIVDALEEKKLTPTEIVLTHSHYDHIGAAQELRERFSVPVSIHADEAANLENAAKNFSLLADRRIQFKADKTLSEGDEWDMDDFKLSVIHTPGHSEGGISLVGNGVILAGDTIFKSGIGRTDLPGGDYGKLKDSIRRLLQYDDTTTVLPGHGPPTTIGRERNFLMEI